MCKFAQLYACHELFCHRNVTCSRQDIAEQLLNCRQTAINHTVTELNFIFFTKKISQFLNLAVEDILVLYPSMQKKKKITDFSPEKNLCLVIFGCKLRNNSWLYLV
jgi:hypothetical protein